MTNETTSLEVSRALREAGIEIDSKRALFPYTTTSGLKYEPCYKSGKRWYSVRPFLITGTIREEDLIITPTITELIAIFKKHKRWDKFCKYLYDTFSARDFGGTFLTSEGLGVIVSIIVDADRLAMNYINWPDRGKK